MVDATASRGDSREDIGGVSREMGQARKSYGREGFGGALDGVVVTGNGRRVGRRRYHGGGILRN